MTWADLIPTLPDTFDEVEGLVFVLSLFVLKLVRPAFLKRRSSYVDRFGWSILVFDWVFAVLVGISTFYAFYPETRAWGGAIWLNRIALAVVTLSALWQAVEVIVAKPVRVEVAMAGVPDDEPWEAGVSAERRKGARRESDVRKDQELAAYRQGIQRMQGGV